MLIIPKPVKMNLPEEFCLTPMDSPSRRDFLHSGHGASASSKSKPHDKPGFHRQVPLRSPPESRRDFPPSGHGASASSKAKPYYTPGFHRQVPLRSPPESRRDFPQVAMGFNPWKVCGWGWMRRGATLEHRAVLIGLPVAAASRRELSTNAPPPAISPSPSAQPVPPADAPP